MHTPGPWHIARLIAAAPELLEACKACIPLVSAHCAAGDLLRAAIAKAEGGA